MISLLVRLTPTFSFLEGTNFGVGLSKKFFFLAV